MATFRQISGVVSLAALCILTSAFAAAQPTVTSDLQRYNRVRSEDPAIASLIAHASDRSPTFRGLAETVNASDGIVYVNPGKCGAGARACLKHQVVVAGRNRILNVLVDTHRPDLDVMGAVGHELRHVVEVLSDPTIMSGRAMSSFYKQYGVMRNGVLETRAAIAAGAAIRSELRWASRYGR